MSTDAPATAQCLHAARACAAAGEDRRAVEHYLEALRLSPDHVDALLELAALAHSAGYRQAAHSAYRRAIITAPDKFLAQVGLGNLLAEDNDHLAAQGHYRKALALRPDGALAHQGLARSLHALGQPESESHWHAGFSGHAVVRQPYRGAGKAIPLLLLVSARGGNIPTKPWIDDRLFAVTAIFADYFDHATALPHHALIVNAIGDAELNAKALNGAERIVARSDMPVVNHPRHIYATSREANARRLSSMPGVIAPKIVRASRHDLMQLPLQYPLLLRSPGFHTGQHFVHVASRCQLHEAAAGLPGDELLIIEHLSARGADGLARKYRVMFIDGRLYPLHFAASTDWKVHYFSAAMAESPALRAEEQRFLADMGKTLGPRAMGALAGIAAALALDYAGIDFALSPDGALLLFEANATMVIHAPDADPVWDYRRPAIDAARGAARAMLKQRLCPDRETAPG